MQSSFRSRFRGRRTGPTMNNPATTALRSRERSSAECHAAASAQMTAVLHTATRPLSRVSGPSVHAF
eukprot:scaffold194976_cov26-Tisochrysis_lutea.AAC.4